MTAALTTIIVAVVLWTLGLADWMVALSTGVAQFGIWLSLAGLIPFAVRWVTRKVQPWSNLPISTTRAHWSLNIKNSGY